MNIVILKEQGDETRVAVSPAGVGHYRKLGCRVLIEAGAGVLAGFSDQAYEQAGAELMGSRKSLLAEANVILSVNPPPVKSIKGLQAKTLIITQIDDDPQAELIGFCQQQGLSLFSMTQIPRISRAQSLDTLSSQANLAGYKAVLEAVSHYQRVVPMMMTAAGMIHPAKVLILGAGVAGLQAIATAKRLGAVVYAFDVRRAAKEQVESLGAEFVEVSAAEDAENTSGYAQETSAEYQAKQAALIAEYAAKSDMIICTALIPGRPAPVLITKAMVESMKPGSVIVDLATSRGGNCEVSQADRVIDFQGVSLIGYSNMAGRLPTTASELYSTNLLNLMRLLLVEDQLVLNPDDEIIKKALLCQDGIYHPLQAILEKSA